MELPKITIFTTNTCAYCKMVKTWLKNKGLGFSEVNLDENPERQKEALDLSGVLTVPITLVENNDSRSVIVGFNLSQLVPAIARK